VGTRAEAFSPDRTDEASEKTDANREVAAV
jgi:hypothetical protein